MYKKVLAAVLLFTIVLYVTACGKESETVTDEPAGSPSVESPSDETGTQDSTDEDSQSTNEGTEDSEGEVSQPEEEASYSFIFSDMPLAAYEVTGLGVGHFQSFYDEHLIDENGDDLGIIQLVRLTPGENTFVIFCIPGDVDVIWNESEWGGDGWYSSIGAAIHSPSGSGQWEAVVYHCSDFVLPQPAGFSLLIRDSNYNEETYDAHINSLVDPWLKWIRFSEIYHPDSAQDDAIYVIEVMTYPGDEYGYDEMDNIYASMIETFENLGATSVKEISVEEALERCNVAVSQEE